MSTVFGIYPGTELDAFTQNATGAAIDLSNYVTLTTTQSVSGQKLFSNVNNVFYGTFIGSVQGSTVSQIVYGSLTVLPLLGGANGYIYANSDITSGTLLSAPDLYITDTAQIDNQLTVPNLTCNTLALLKDVQATGNSSTRQKMTVGVSGYGTPNTFVADPSTGFVGIRKGVPARALDVNGDFEVTSTSYLQDITLTGDISGSGKTATLGTVNTVTLSASGTSSLGPITLNGKISGNAQTADLGTVNVTSLLTLGSGGYNTIYANNTTGRVGILNNAPTAALDVTGAGKFSGTMTSSSVYATTDLFVGANNLTVQSNKVGIITTMPAEALDVTGNMKISGSTTNGLIFADNSKQTTAYTTTGTLNGSELVLKSGTAYHKENIVYENRSYSFHALSLFINAPNGYRYYFVPTINWMPETNPATLYMPSQSVNYATVTISTEQFALCTCPVGTGASADYSKFSYSWGPTYLDASGYMFEIVGLPPICLWDTRILSIDTTNKIVTLSAPCFYGFSGALVQFRRWIDDSYHKYAFSSTTVNAFYTSYPNASHYDKNYLSGATENFVVKSRQNSVYITNNNYDENDNGLTLDCPLFGRDQFAANEYFGSSCLYTKHNVGYTIHFSAQIAPSRNGGHNNFGSPINILNCYTRDNLYDNTLSRQFTTMSNGVWLIMGHVEQDPSFYVITPEMERMKLTWGAPTGGTLINKSTCSSQAGNTSYPGFYYNMTNNEFNPYTTIMPWPTAIVVMNNNGVNTNLCPYMEAEYGENPSYLMWVTCVITATRIA